MRSGAALYLNEDAESSPELDDLACVVRAQIGAVARGRIGVAQIANIKHQTDLFIFRAYLIFL